MGGYVVSDPYKSEIMTKDIFTSSSFNNLEFSNLRVVDTIIEE
jgi:hypothetical protein